MRQLSWHDLQWSLRRCPEAVLQLLKEKPGKVFVAGGFVRACIATEHINDVDLFVPSKDEAWAAAHYLALKIKQARTVETKNAISVYGRPASATSTVEGMAPREQT
jgi:tRNA nucleotidyltransferase/poly(A) polymerase